MSGLVAQDPESLVTLDAESLNAIKELFEWLREDTARLKVKFVDPNQRENKKNMLI